MAQTDQGENIEAIAHYIGEQVKPVTGEAVTVRDEWQRFYSGLSWYELNYEQATYDKARNIRLRYNRANARTPAERAAVEEQALRGLTTEQIDGDADRRTSTGEYIPAPEQVSPGKVLVVVGLGLAALLLLKFK